MLGPILPGQYVGPNVNYTDSTNIKKRRQRTVEMGCTNWEAGLTSSDISVSPSIVMPRRSIVMPRHELPSVPQASENFYWTSTTSKSWVVAGNTDILLAAPHRTTVCLSSETSSSYKNIQLTSSYISIYKDQ